MHSEYFDGLGSWVVRDAETRQFVRVDDGFARFPRVLRFAAGTPGERSRAAWVAACLDSGTLVPSFRGIPGTCGPVVGLEGLRSVLGRSVPSS